MQQKLIQLDSKTLFTLTFYTFGGYYSIIYDWTHSCKSLYVRPTNKISFVVRVNIIYQAGARVHIKSFIVFYSIHFMSIVSQNLGCQKFLTQEISDTQHPSFISFCFIRIFQNCDGQKIVTDKKQCPPKIMSDKIVTEKFHYVCSPADESPYKIIFIAIPHKNADSR